MYNQDSNAGLIIFCCYFLTLENFQRYAHWMPAEELYACNVGGHAPAGPRTLCWCSLSSGLRWHPTPVPFLDCQTKGALWPVSQPHKLSAQRLRGTRRCKKCSAFGTLDLGISSHRIFFFSHAGLLGWRRSLCIWAVGPVSSKR